eukprot:m.59137 g.59137  ORF g.59137 m.59137 type:complete len:1177 (+) comp11308_c0_seq1:177-3707(+)
MSNDNVESYQDAFPSLPSSRKRPQQPVRTGPYLRRTANYASSASERIVIPLTEQRTRNTTSFRKGKSEMENQIKRIKLDHSKVTITHSVSPNGDLTVLIKGGKEDVSNAKKSVLSRLQTQAKINIEIPREHFGFIIGPKGATLKELSQKYSVKINVPKDDKTNAITIIGTTANCKRAAQDIKNISLDRAKKDSRKLPVLKAYHALVAGPNNATIKRIEQQHGVRIHIPPQSSTSDEIIVNGDRDPVSAACDEILRLYKEKLESCGELTAQIPRTQHRFIIGPKGMNLRSITEETGVIVEVPSVEKNDDTIILRGDRSKLAAALALVYEFANKFAVKTLDVPHWVHRHLIGEKGKNIRKLREERPKVYVKFPDGDSTEITLEGPTEDVDAVRDSLRTLSNELTSTLKFEILNIPVEYHQHIIGQNGSKIQQIRNSTGAFVNATKGSDEVRIEGTPEAVEKAKKEITDFVKKIQNQKTVTVNIPSRLHSQIIGSRGETIRTLRQQFPSVNIQFPDRDDDSDAILIRGDKKDVDACVPELKALAKKVESENYSETVHVFRMFHTNIIGKNGEVIKKIREKTNVRINVPSVEEESDNIVLTGLKENVAKAKVEILAIQDSAGNIVTKELNIDPKYHSTIRGAGGKILESLQAELSVLITVPGAKEKSTKVKVYGPSDSVDVATSTILKLATDESLAATTQEIDCPRKFVTRVRGKDRASAKAIVEESGVVHLAFPPRRSKNEKIIAIGSKDACAAAKKLIDDRVAELIKSVTKELEMDNKYFSGFRTNNFLRNLEKEHAVRIILKNDDNKVVVIGPADGVDSSIEALQAQAEFFDNAVTKEFIAKSGDIPSILGQRGANIQALCKNHSVTVDIPDKSKRGGDEEVAIKVTGLEEDTVAAIASLEQLIPISVVVNVPSSLHRFLIMDKESGVSVIRSKYNVNVDVPGRNSDSDEITLRGKAENVEEARAFLLEVLKQNFVLTFSIPQQFHREIIGTRGAKVNELRKKYDVKIELTRDSDDVSVIGEEEKCNECAAEIKELVAVLESFVTKEAEIHNAVHGKIIGPRGANVRELQDKHKVKVNFPKERNSNVISVTGPEQGVDECIDELYLIQDEHQDLVEDAMDMERHVKPSRTEEPVQQAPQSNYKIADAPWEGTSNTASFPTLGSNAKSNLQGVWATRK